MGQGSLPNIEFSQALGYKWPCTQSSLLVVFVCKAKICAQLFDYHAEGLANTASFLPRDSSDSPRRDGAVAAFLQPDRASSSAATIPSGTRRNAGYHPSDLIVLLYASWRACDVSTKPTSCSLSGTVASRTEEDRKTPV